ncbi:shikimate kinase [Bacteroidota bacterium]
MKTNIALIGFMGTGKTVAGRVLAAKLHKQFVEMDSLIEKKAGKSITDIFQQDGEVAFREMEIETAKEVASGKNLVIACGGGIILNKINVDRLRQGAVVILLTASPDIILRRTSGDDVKRPLLAVPDPALAIRELLKFRELCYERAADVAIDTSNLDMDAVVELITEKVKEYESLNS